MMHAVFEMESLRSGGGEKGKVTCVYTRICAGLVCVYIYIYVHICMHVQIYSFMLWSRGELQGGLVPFDK